VQLNLWGPQGADPAVVGLRFTMLGSGSTGNATVVETVAEPGHRPSRLLIDCGFTLHQLTRRLAARGLEPDDLDAVFLTHEHADHVGCLGALLRKHPLRVLTSQGTWQASAARLGLPVSPAHDTQSHPGGNQWARSGTTLQVGSLTITPFSVPHDASDPLQLVVEAGGRRLGVVTDLGHPRDDVAQALAGCHSLVLETNHDEELLAQGPYPAFLRRRIAGHLGHLANHQSAALLQACWHPGLTRVVAAHLSQHNNSADLALNALQAATARASTRPYSRQQVDLQVADAATGTAWLAV
jgi:phosphoribosyl 1,2-cyclic phosphodiesterase